jgi:mRNA interferase RelE/StbE
VTYSIIWKAEAIEGATRLHKIDPIGADLILAAVYDLADNPKPSNSVLLGTSGLRRLLLGYYRVLYHVSDGTVTVTVMMVGKAAEPR